MTQDFVSALLLSLIHRSMVKQGILPRRPQALPREALADLADKRAVLNGLWGDHGPLAVLRIGEAVADLPADPVSNALLLARDCHDLVSRWCRVERFIHSRHRVKVVYATDFEVAMQHVSLAANQPPTMAEDCLILSVLTGIATRIGIKGLRAWLGPDIVFHSGTFVAPTSAALAASTQWRLEWEMVEAAACEAETRTELASDFLPRVRALLAADCARAWSASSLAREIAVSERTLQRRLSEQGTSLHALLRDVQLVEATRLLLETRQSVQEIAFVCGFADQAHFTRAFKRRTRLPPARFRKELAIL